MAKTLQVSIRIGFVCFSRLLAYHRVEVDKVMQVKHVEPPILATPRVVHGSGIGPLGPRSKVPEHGGAEANHHHHGGRHPKITVQVECPQI